MEVRSLLQADRVRSCPHLHFLNRHHTTWKLGTAWIGGGCFTLWEVACQNALLKLSCDQFLCFVRHEVPHLGDGADERAWC